MKKIAIIDLGTNSLKFYAIEVYEDGKYKTLYDTYRVTRLGQGIKKTGRISSEAIFRTIEAISIFVSFLKKNQFVNIYAIGTMALRNAKNANDFIRKVYNLFGIKIIIISGDDEARLSYIAATYNLANSNENIFEDNIIVFDSGGGSTEIIYGKGSEYSKSISLNLGAVHLTEHFYKSDPVTDEEFDNSMRHISLCLQSIDINKKIEKVIGQGGAATTVAAVKAGTDSYNPELIRGTKIGHDEILRQVRLYKSKTFEKRKKIPGLEPDRADIILAGAAILYNILKKMDLKKIIISDYGIRHGFIIEKFF